MKNKNKGYMNRPQQGQPQHNNQPKVEQKQENAPLANIVDSAPTVEYASDAEVAALKTLLSNLAGSAEKFGDTAVEVINMVIEPIRNRIMTVGTLSAEDKKDIERLQDEIEEIEAKAGCGSPFEAVSLAAYNALEEEADKMSAQWRDYQALIATFGGEQKEQMTAADYKDAIDSLAPQQVLAFIWATADLEGCPSIFVEIESSFNEVLEDDSSEEEAQPKAQEQPQIAVV